MAFDYRRKAQTDIMNNIKHLEDFKINVKFKLSALWTAVMFCYIYGDYFSLYVPTCIAGFISGETMLDSPLKLFAASMLMAIPAYATERHHFDRALVDILCIPGPRRKLHHPIDCLVCMEMAGTKQHS